MSNVCWVQCSRRRRPGIQLISSINSKSICTLQKGLATQRTSPQCVSKQMREFPYGTMDCDAALSGSSEFIRHAFHVHKFIPTLEYPAYTERWRLVIDLLQYSMESHEHWTVAMRKWIARTGVVQSQPIRLLATNRKLDRLEQSDYKTIVGIQMVCEFRAEYLIEQFAREYKRNTMRLDLTPIEPQR